MAEISGSFKTYGAANTGRTLQQHLVGLIFEDCDRVLEDLGNYDGVTERLKNHVLIVQGIADEGFNYVLTPQRIAEAVAECASFIREAVDVALK